MRKLLLVFCLFIQLSSALDRQPNSDYRARRQALASKIKNGVVLLFAPNEAEGPNDLYGYRPDDNFFYLSGWSEPGAALLIAASPEHSYTEILFLPDHNPSQEKWTGPKLGPENTEAAKITGFERVAPLDNLRSELVRLLPAPKTTIYTDIPAGEKVSNSTSALDWLKRANGFPVYVSFQDVRPLLASLRTVKDAGEIERIRKATDASVAAHLAAMRAMKPRMTEREISALMQYEWGKRGCEQPACTLPTSLARCRHQENSRRGSVKFTTSFLEHSVRPLPPSSRGNPLCVGINQTRSTMSRTTTSIRMAKIYMESR